MVQRKSKKRNAELGTLTKKQTLKPYLTSESTIKRDLKSGKLKLACGKATFKNSEHRLRRRQSRRPRYVSQVQKLGQSWLSGSISDNFEGFCSLKFVPRRQKPW